MANVAVYNMEGKEVDKIELNDSIFGVEINEHLVHMAVLQQLANKLLQERRKQKWQTYPYTIWKVKKLAQSS